MITVTCKGDFSKTIKSLKRLSNGEQFKGLEVICQEGVEALSKATPVDTGVTADSWSYEIIRKKDEIIINWKNSSNSEGIPIVILLQYGHGTRQGGYVQGQDFINPAMRPIFDKLSENLWKEVKRING